MYQFTASTLDRVVSIDYVVESFIDDIHKTEAGYFYIHDNTRYRGYINLDYTPAGYPRLTKYDVGHKSVYHTTLETKEPTIAEIAYAIGFLLG